MGKTSKDWLAWHDPYKDPSSPLSRRLKIVQQQLRQMLPALATHPIDIVSICAGQGDDLLGVLDSYPSRDFVNARLVEIDERNVEAARKRIEEMRLQNVSVTLGDAALLSVYEGSVPADIVLACGVFGNISDDDIFHTIEALPQLCKPGAGLIWTRTRHTPDITPRIREYLHGHEFAEIDFIAPTDVEFSVGVHRFEGVTHPLQTEDKMFSFIT